MKNKLMVKEMKRRRKRTGSDHAVSLKDLQAAKRAATRQREGKK